MRKLNVTKHNKYEMYEQADGYYLNDVIRNGQAICRVYIRIDDNGSQKDNAYLIKDAFNTYRQTDLLPSELHSLNKELAEALKELTKEAEDLMDFCIDRSHLDNEDKTDGQLLFDNALNKAKSALDKFNQNK